jgi:hypothetical protein
MHEDDVNQKRTCGEHTIEYLTLAVSDFVKHHSAIFVPLLWDYLGFQLRSISEHSPYYCLMGSVMVQLGVEII